VKEKTEKMVGGASMLALAVLMALVIGTTYKYVQYVQGTAKFYVYVAEDVNWAEIDSAFAETGNIAIRVEAEDDSTIDLWVYSWKEKTIYGDGEFEGQKYEEVRSVLKISAGVMASMDSRDEALNRIVDMASITQFKRHLAKSNALKRWFYKKMLGD